LLNAILFTVINYYFFEVVISKIFTNFYFISFNSNLKLFAVFIIFLIITTFIKLTEEWIYFNKNENKKLQNEKQLIEEKLSSLRSQINPHFLFNSLNTIYAMALDGDKKITKSIVQLSDILRYVIYDTNTSKVKILKEIELINNYLNFQKTRLNTENFTVSFQKEVKNPNFVIYPMLLLPLVENAFKHGLSKSLTGFLSIHILQQENEFYFEIKNSFDENRTENSGVGLKNIQKNLEIMYPNNYEFNINSKTNTFTVQLKIVQNETN
jgi:LytS/YehU family sensor histidine kinase